MWLNIVGMGVAIAIGISLPGFAENTLQGPKKTTGIFTGGRVAPASPPLDPSHQDDLVAALQSRGPSGDQQIRASGSGRESPGDQRLGSVVPSTENLSIREQTSGNPEGRYEFLEIDVNHVAHHLKLMGNTVSGAKELLHECRVGLGGSGFPTPKGEYFVTHIYPDDPWWIPPRDRAWAWGQLPSKKVYGGTMAPLLKKTFVFTRKKLPADLEDYISSEVKLNDYGYRFHGTNAPRSIGRNESHGCVRMLPTDAKKVAALIIEHTGVVAKRESENGSFVVLRQPVRLRIW